MKKVLYSMLALLAMATTAQAATDYGFYVGGVKVNSDNYTQIVEKSSDISKGTVTYNHSTKTLTLTDITMSRSGDDKNGIDNYGCDGLKIVFKGTNELACKDASVIQCKTNTTIECATGSSTTLNYKGNQYRVIYLWGGNLTIQGKGELKILASGSGKGIEGKNATETLTINNTQLTITSDDNGLCDLANVTFSGNSSTTLKPKSTSTSNQRVENVQAMTFNGQQHIDAPENAKFNAMEKSITWSSGIAITYKTIVINADAIWLNKANDKIPDENFCKALRDRFGKDCLMKSEAKDVKEIAVDDKGIKSLKGIEYFTNLKKLSCAKNLLTSIDVSGNTLLEILDFHNNQLTTLDLSANVRLSELYCDDNKLTSLNVSNNTLLKMFMCRNNQLTTLDLSKSKKLMYFYCNNNQLTSIQISNAATNFTSFRCFSNKIRGEEMQKIVDNLPVSTMTDNIFAVIYSGDPNEQNFITKEQVNIAKAKDWIVYNYSYWAEDYPGWSSSTGLSFSATTATATLGEPFTAPTLNNPNSYWVNGITYSSSNPEVATVDDRTGAVKLVGAGTTTITASYAGWHFYFPADNVSYKLTVNESTGIETVMNEQPTDGCWYTLDGQKLQGEPTQKGIYIYKGKKIVK